MSAQESDNLFKHMRLFEALKLYTMQFIIRTKHSLRLIDILLICLVISIGLITFTTSINYARNFKEQATSIVKNTALSLQMIDGEIEDHLQTATYAIELELLKKAPSQNELEELARKFKVTIIYLDNADGTIHMSTNEPIKNSQHSEFLKTNLMLDLKQCEICDSKFCRSKYEIRNCKIDRTVTRASLIKPDVVFFNPLFQKFSLPRKIVSKQGVMHSSKLNKFITVDIAYKDYEKTINEVLKANSEHLTYIAITDGEGNIIAETGKADKNSIQISLPYGEKLEFEIEGEKVGYSYILKMEFKNTIYNVILGGLFLLTTLLIAILIAIIRIRFYDKDKSINKKDKEIHDKDRAIQILETTTPMIVRKTK